MGDVTCSLSVLLTDILRVAWVFTGHVPDITTAWLPKVEYLTYIFNEASLWELCSIYYKN